MGIVPDNILEPFRAVIPPLVYACARKVQLLCIVSRETVIGLERSHWL